MEETLHNAVEELKRVEHLVYVSLKYTRTVDVLMNIINRMVEAYEFTINALLMKQEDVGTIDALPGSPLEKAKLVKELFTDEEEDKIVQDNISIYLLLRKVQRSVPERENEYRRHVTLITFINNQEERIDIDIITQYYLFQKQFVEYVSKALEVGEE